MGQMTKETTLGSSLVMDPRIGFHRINDIRFNLEIKLAACLANGSGTNGCPIQPHRIHHPAIRSLVSYGMIFPDWSMKDLTECTDRLEGAAAMALIATLEDPVWGADDYHLFSAIERMEQLQQSAWRSGRTL